jgi:hypothetical protein
VWAIVWLRKEIRMSLPWFIFVETSLIGGFLLFLYHPPLGLAILNLGGAVMLFGLIWMMATD